MKFECGDLERAFANPNLMPDARAHIKTCNACREEFRLWTEISSAAAQLHEEWDTPGLWPQIREKLQAQQKPITGPLWKNWKTWAVAAALLITVGAASLLFERPEASPLPLQAVASQNQDFLTEQALLDVEKNEAAYRKSIDQLTRLAEPRLKDGAASSAAINTREKLLMLDAAIADTRGNVASNRFNLHLQTTLAGLYHEKQQTLKDLLSHAKNN
jgi:hypothetical protein